MALSKEELQHLADLARIHLKEEDMTRFQTEFSSIIEFVSRLEGIVPSESAFSHASGALNVMREDGEEIESLGRREDLLQDFVTHDTRGNLVVPNIFES
jgi:aspartyl/glutamyl-tRNA(Asn/Gln) amidotransferase C subunit